MNRDAEKVRATTNEENSSAQPHRINVSSGILRRQDVFVMAVFSLLSLATMRSVSFADDTTRADVPAPDAAAETTITPDSPDSATETSADSEARKSTAGTGAAKGDAVKLPLPPGLSPYRLRVWVAFERDPTFNAAFQETVRKRIAVRLSRIFGATCDLDGNEVAEPTWLSPQSLTGLGRLTEEQVRGQLDEKRIDKGLIAFVSRNGSRFRIACREWDAARRRLSETADGETWDRALIADTTADLLRRVFQPTCIVETVDIHAKSAILRVRAGSLPLGNPDEKLLAPGDALVPFMRYLDQKQILKNVQQIPWTYLIVDEIAGSTARCSALSGGRAPLGTNRRRRVESLAIRVQAVYPESDLRLTLLSKETKALGGYKISVSPRTVSREQNAATPPQQIVTDRDGRFRLKVHPEAPVLWLTVRNGEALLARVPYAPGIERNSEMQLPDDSLRLGVERELDLLKSKLIETVAQRATITARALSLARLGQADEARKILAETEKIAKPAEFESQLNAIRVPALESARKSKDRLAEARIRRLSTTTADLINVYLAADKFKVVRDEIEQLIEAAKTPPKPNAGPKAAPEQKSAPEPKAKAVPDAKQRKGTAF